ncbi:N-acetyltransferase DgcN [Parasphingorhabdus sp.]|uniref:N-acetyltransferase DgcN n=1 Tax=Parasphingorhabdus sp. TaxID=2709688 RepID=UPI003265350E
MFDLKTPYLLFLGHEANPLAIKTSRGIAQWRPDLCIGENGSQLTLDLPKFNPREAAEKGARTFVIGLTNTTGEISKGWIPDILAAIDAGLDIANGLHQRLRDIKEIRVAAERKNVRLHDVRHQFGELPIGTGQKRSGKRMLMVGTDCSVGKMYSALAVEREMKSREFNVDFRATGQTGILIAGEGVPIDAVVSDYIAGAVEHLCPASNDAHWDVIEGQGSLFNPAYAGVSLGLLHGAQADVLVMCHEAGREQIKDKPGYAIPDMQDCIETNLKMARLTNPEARLGAISLNCRLVGADQANRLCHELEEQFSVPCFDPMIHGAGGFIDLLS